MFKYAALELGADYEIVLEAGKLNAGYALFIAAPELKADRERTINKDGATDAFQTAFEFVELAESRRRRSRHTMNKDAHAIESNAEQVKTGVRCARPANRSAAARTSSNPGKVNSSATPFGYPANTPLATPRKTTFLMPLKPHKFPL